MLLMLEMKGCAGYHCPRSVKVMTMMVMKFLNLNSNPMEHCWTGFSQGLDTDVD
ncbi:unnamed protein product [Linum tenue]|uniref:Uncharacterized protein n=1 Tax=Linum tenue TaxID=586396 RepID=A0AAV0N9Q0_9ROSI|nr:unnamed protein product [Linum tenue]